MPTKQPHIKDPASLACVSPGTTGWERPRVVVGGTHLYTGRFRNVQSIREGREGEERVVEMMVEILDGRWTIFRDLVLPGRAGDIDIVLVGPPGIFAVEVKAYTGNYKLEKGRWYKQTSNGSWAKKGRGPNAQVRGNAAALCDYIKGSGITNGNYVRTAVVLAKDTAIDVVSSGTEVWRLEELERKLFELRGMPPRRNMRVEQVVELLESAPGVGHTPTRITGAGGAVGMAVGTEGPRAGHWPVTESNGSGKRSTRSTARARGYDTVYFDRRRVGLLLIALALVAMGGAVMLGGAANMLRGNPNVVPEVGSEAGNGKAGGQEGAVVALKPLKASASGSAAASKDSLGNVVTFDPKNAIDGDTATAWRVPGDGAGQYLDIELGKPVLISQIGLLPGYAKMDPGDGTDRFKQNRRVRKVKLIFGDGISVEENLADEAVVQMFPVRPVVSSSVRVAILETTAPGAKDGRDFTPIGEIVVMGQEAVR